LEAGEDVDSGRIWRKLEFQAPKHALWNEINDRLFAVEIELIDFSVEHFDEIIPNDQPENKIASYYPRRNPEDSRIDTRLSIEEQFDLLRVCDPNRFPAFFDLHGHRYKVTLEKISDKTDFD
jgi:methionyl-tRNA formyltransferase